MSEDIVKESIKCLANMEIKETTYQVARSVVLDEIERLHSIIKEVREYCDKEIGNIIAYFDYVDTKDLENIKKILDKENKND